VASQPYRLTERNLARVAARIFPYRFAAAFGGRATNVKLLDVRRVYMPRIKYWVYYHVLREPQYVS